MWINKRGEGGSLDKSHYLINTFFGGLGCPLEDTQGHFSFLLLLLVASMFHGPMLSNCLTVYKSLGRLPLE